jgi:hypothetical protein
MDYKSLLASIYSPDIGSLWCVSDGIWETGFAANKSSSDFHPALVGKIEPTGSSCRLIPGTSQEFKKVLVYLKPLSILIFHTPKPHTF